MKINYLSCQNAHCGLGQYTQQLALASSHIGNKVKAYRKDGDSSRTFSPYPYRSFKFLRPYIAPLYLAKAIKNEQADIWQADYLDSATGAIHAYKTSNLFVTVHDAIPFEFNRGAFDLWYYKSQLQNVTSYAKSLIVVSDDAREKLLHYAKLRPDQVVTVHNGIDHERFYPRLVTRQESPRIKYLGGLGARHKNAMALLEAAHILEKEEVDFVMEIGGYLPENHLLRKRAAELKLKNVRFVGFVSDDQLPFFYSSADVFFFPSLSEGFGFPPLEAMACGAPTVVSDIPVLREILGSAASFATPTAQGYAEKITALLQSNLARNSATQKGLAQAAKYNWKLTAEKMQEVYRNYGDLTNGQLDLLTQSNFQQLVQG